MLNIEPEDTLDQRVFSRDPLYLYDILRKQVTYRNGN